MLLPAVQKGYGDEAIFDTLNLRFMRRQAH